MEEVLRVSELIQHIYFTAYAQIYVYIYFLSALWKY